MHVFQFSTLDAISWDLMVADGDTLHIFSLPVTIVQLLPHESCLLVRLPVPLGVSHPSYQLVAGPFLSQSVALIR